MVQREKLTGTDCAELQTVNGAILTAAIKGCSYIYAPAGQAEEYAPLAANPYRGCGHGCAYCYVPGVLKMTRPEFDAGATPREDYIDHLVKDARKYQQAGITEQVMLSFTTDPYHPGDTTLTRQTLEVLRAHGMGFCTLTKGGTRALRDLDLFRPDRDAFASTLTSLNDGFSRRWERNAALPEDRLAALRAFYEAGIFTWVSLEPTLDVESSLGIIEATHSFVNLFKVGRANYLGTITKDTDWRDYTERIIELCGRLDVAHYIKKDLQPFLPAGYYNPMRVPQYHPASGQLIPGTYIQTTSVTADATIDISPSALAGRPIIMMPERALASLISPAVQEMPATIPLTADVVTGARIPPGEGKPANHELASRMFRAGVIQDEVLAAVSARDGRREHQLGKTGRRHKVAEWTARYSRGQFVAALRRADLLKLADVESKEVEWLWRPYLPAGMLAMLSGDPGAGKTFLALAMAAALTTGRVPFSGESCTPIDVLYMSVENDPACVVRPRFDALGGNAARLHLVRGTVVGEGEKAERDGVWLSDVSALRDALDTTHARLLIVDPIQSYLGAAVDAHRSNETRPVLDGLVRLAEAHRCCVLLLRHLAKAKTGRAIHRGLGSIDLTGAVRSEMLVGNPPTDPQQRAMVQIKNNLGAYGPALGYVIDATGKLSWTGESSLTQSDILAPESSVKDSALDEAVEFLREYLAAGPRPTKDVQRAARARGISWRTVERAKKDVGVTSRPGGFECPWVLELQSPPTLSMVRQDDVLTDTAKLGGVCEFDQRDKGKR